jgi:hypothetical protein
VTLANPPLAAVAAKLWDDPRARSDHVYAWRSAKARLEPLPEGRRWSAVRGLVDGALTHLLERGASWPKPFVVTLLDQEINILVTPPKQLTRIVRGHIRRFLDKELLQRLGRRIGWDQECVDRKYVHGIDWALIRSLLRGDSTDLSAAEKRALEVLSCGAFWPEGRRWLAGGGLPTGTCHRCFSEIADERHSLVDCAALQADIMWARIAGRFQGQWQELHDPALAPLMLAGLPPLLFPVAPEDLDYEEGDVSYGSCGTFYGDASGVGCEARETGIVTWGLIQLCRDAEDREGGGLDDDADEGTAVNQMVRGRCTGWFPSVPRGELLALLHFSRRVRIPSTYVGDCRYVTDAVAQGGPCAVHFVSLRPRRPMERDEVAAG